MKELVERLLAGIEEGSPEALARVISLVERGAPEVAQILPALQSRLGRALVVGMTGAPGVGKSTLTSALIRAWRSRQRAVGVVAIDPSSPRTGGALLGDRLRMREHVGDEGVFVRSLASRGGPGGLSPIVTQVIDLMDAGNREIILVETVGVGQTEVAVADVVDVNLFITAPGLGDEIQAAKAGVLEIADLIVMNKSDRADAAQCARQLQGLPWRRGGHGDTISVLNTDALSGAGVEQLVDAVEAMGAGVNAGDRSARRDAHVRHLLCAEVAVQLLAQLDGVDELCAAVRRGECDLSAAAAQLLKKRD
jgi:LAO/AO transport system kinase